ncbi:hypothetical protein XpruCFBP8354_21675 [Xanthomonas prunicola]|uniref:Uncharacterized protein n=1 Tax=Xanthomonas prunicola TaxID=2053930 RepID=A0ABX4RF52_9XANT|nr:hypothetical protein XpruCFBP8354_21675 [Xanthomonas prunicola]
MTTTNLDHVVTPAVLPRPRRALETVAARRTAARSSTGAKCLRHNAKAPQCGALAFSAARREVVLPRGLEPLF